MMSSDRVAIVLTLIILSFSAAGCDLFGKDEEAVKKYDYVFINDTYYSVTVKPDGQTSWSEFTLSPNTQKTVSIPETRILFKYNQANFILCDNSVTGKLRFYNRTMLMIKNSSSAYIDFVKWREYYFGNDLVWDTVLGKYVYGLKPGSAYINEVTPGSDYVYFYFTTGGTRFRTTTLVSVAKEEQKTFTFVDTTIIVQASFVGGKPGDIHEIPIMMDVEPVPGTGDEDRTKEASAATSEPLDAPAGTSPLQDPAQTTDGNTVFAGMQGAGE